MRLLLEERLPSGRTWRMMPTKCLWYVWRIRLLSIPLYRSMASSFRYSFVLVQPFVIAWLDSNVVFDIRVSILICGSLCFLCRYFALRHVVYLHQSALTIQILGVILGLIPGTSECTLMLPEVSQEYLCAKRELCDRPRGFLSATGFGHAKRLA